MTPLEAKAPLPENVEEALRLFHKQGFHPETDERLFDAIVQGVATLRAHISAQAAEITELNEILDKLHERISYGAPDHILFHIMDREKKPLPEKPDGCATCGGSGGVETGSGAKCSCPDCAGKKEG